MALDILALTCGGPGYVLAWHPIRIADKVYGDVATNRALMAGIYHIQSTEVTPYA